MNEGGRGRGREEGTREGGRGRGREGGNKGGNEGGRGQGREGTGEGGDKRGRSRRRRLGVRTKCFGVRTKERTQRSGVRQNIERSEAE